MPQPSSVRRRHVFYLSGFDPNGPARYHKLYCEGAAQQSGFSGASVEVGPRTRVRDETDTMAWKVSYRDADADADAEVETSYVFPRWDKIVRDYWWQDRGPQLRDLLKTSWQYLHTGAHWKMFRQSRPAFNTVFMPFLLLLVMLPGLVLALGTVLDLARDLRNGASLLAPIALTGLSAVLALTWVYWARRHWHAQWILRGYAFVGRMGGPGVLELDARLDEMATALCRQVQKHEDEEILVVGHSVGTIVAVSVLARAFRQDPELARRGPAIGLLTLGHCTPLLSNLPAARRFRDELAVLAAQPGLCWADFSDPMDSYSFGGVDPVRAAGLESPRAGHPLVLSPDFARLFQSERFRGRHQGAHEIHQQYLNASMPGDAYDFFAMTAGPLTLEQRLATPSRA